MLTDYKSQRQQILQEKAAALEKLKLEKARNAEINKQKKAAEKKLKEEQKIKQVQPVSAVDYRITIVFQVNVNRLGNVKARP